MSGLSRRLKQLDEELLALGEETMLLEELDGFIAGLLVCPDLIKPGEWLPIVWNRDSADHQPATVTMSTGVSVSSCSRTTVWSVRSWSAPTATAPCSPSLPVIATSPGFLAAFAAGLPSSDAPI